MLIQEKHFRLPCGGLEIEWNILGLGRLEFGDITILQFRGCFMAEEGKMKSLSVTLDTLGSCNGYWGLGILEDCCSKYGCEFSARTQIEDGYYRDTEFRLYDPCPECGTVVIFEIDDSEKLTNARCSRGFPCRWRENPEREV